MVPKEKEEGPSLINSFDGSEFKLYTHLLFVNQVRVSTLVLGTWGNKFEISQMYKNFLATKKSKNKLENSFQWYPEKLKNFELFKVV